MALLAGHTCISDEIARFCCQMRLSCVKSCRLALSQPTFCSGSRLRAACREGTSTHHGGSRCTEMLWHGLSTACATAVWQQFYG